MKSPDRLLSAALRYAEMGYRVIPLHSVSDGECSCVRPGCPSPGKHPRTSAGLKDGSSDETRIESWWSRWPEANIGLLTDGLLVVDDDGATWPANAEHRLDLGTAPTATTPRGGRHSFFRAPDGHAFRNTVGKIADKIDTRANGGYVVVAPSSGPTAAYVWQTELDALDHLPPAPEWLIEAQLRAQNGHTTGENGEAHAEDADLQAILDNGVGQGRRNDAVARVAGHYFGRGFKNDEILVLIREWNQRNRPPLEDAELSDVVASIGRRDRQSSSKTARPHITVRAGELREAVVQAEFALLQADQLDPVFQRGDQLVRVAKMDERFALSPGVELPAHMPVLERVLPTYLRSLIEEAAEFYRFDRSGKRFRTQCPMDVVSAYMQSAGLWRLPQLRAVVQAPALRPDGTVLQVPGYDATSRLFFDPAGVVFPAIPDEPTRDDAVAAIATMLQPVEHFSFVCPWDKAVWLAALLTPFVRPSLPSAPMFVFDAPVRASGKGKLANIIAKVAAGNWPATMSFVDDSDEQRKRILALLMQGTPIVNIDNVDRPMGGASFCTVLTEPVFEDRILRESKTARVPTTTTWLATGNNVTVVGDLTRRVLMCRIDPRHENPEERRFPFEPVSFAQTMRPRLVAAALTLLRAHAVAGRPDEGIEPFGSFEEWSRVVRGALVWAGEEDPMLGRQAVRESDTELEQFRVFITNWHALFGPKPMTIRAALNEAGSSFRGEEGAALLATAEELTGEADDMRRRRKLGQVIAMWQKRIVGSLRFMDLGLHHGIKRWRTEVATD